MSSHFNPETVAMVVSVWREKSYWSKEDGCTLVDIPCQECGVYFADELDAAITKISSDIDLLCISCDPSSSERISGLTLTGLIPTII